MNWGSLLGFLGADAEERFTSSGKRVVSFRLAVRLRKEETVWWRVSIWGDRFDKLIPYLRKGTQAVVAGEMGKPETYVDREGKTQISLSISAEMIQLVGKGDKENAPAGSSFTPSSNFSQGGRDAYSSNSYGSAGSSYTPDMGSNSSAEEVYAGDDLPF